MAESGSFHPWVSGFNHPGAGLSVEMRFCQEQFGFSQDHFYPTNDWDLANKTRHFPRFSPFVGI